MWPFKHKCVRGADDTVKLKNAAHSLAEAERSAAILRQKREALEEQLFAQLEGLAIVKRPTHD